MCGIIGALEPTEEHRARFSAALEALSHRGPDYTGQWSDQSVALGHQRLTVLDLTAKGHQPMIDPETGLVLIYNGEIYNYLELKDRFLKDEEFTSTTDSEVLLKLFRKLGASCLDHLNGIFAFAIYDPRDRSLFMARDPLGTKPLFYSKAGDSLLFASEIKGILGLGFRAVPKESMIARYLEAGENGDYSQSFFEGVLPVPPGHFVECRDSKFKIQRYWSVSTLEPPFLDDQDWVEKSFEMLDRAISLQEMGDVPIGVALSAGLDSNVVLRFLLKHRKRDAPPLHAFTFGFDEEKYDQIRGLRDWNIPEQVQVHSYVLGPEVFFETLEKQIQFYEYPIGGLGNLGLFHLMKKAREEKVPVLLSGEGADEIFGGYRYYFHEYFMELQREGKWKELREELGFYNRLHGESLGVEDVSQMASHGIQAPDGSKLESSSLLGERFSDRFSPEQRQNCSTRLERMNRDLIRDKLPKLLMFQDRAAMAHGIENRVPFLDRDLVNWSRQIPKSILMKNGQGKALLRQVLERYFDFSCVVTKRYMPTPQREWFKGPLKVRTLEEIEAGLLVRDGWVDFKKFRNQYEAYCASGELGNSFFVWKTLNLEFLMRAFFK